MSEGEREWAMVRTDDELPTLDNVSAEVEHFTYREQFPIISSVPHLSCGQFAGENPLRTPHRVGELLQGSANGRAAGIGGKS